MGFEPRTFKRKRDHTASLSYPLDKQERYNRAISANTLTRTAFLYGFEGKFTISLAHFREYTSKPARPFSWKSRLLHDNKQNIDYRDLLPLNVFIIQQALKTIRKQSTKEWEKRDKIIFNLLA